jgi:excisionase family DNA binding protein
MFIYYFIKKITNAKNDSAYFTAPIVMFVCPWGGVGCVSMLKMENLLTVKKIAEKLSIKPSTVYQWAHARFMPHLQIGKCIRFNEQDIEKWVEKRKIQGRIRYKIQV